MIYLPPTPSPDFPKRFRRFLLRRCRKRGRKIAVFWRWYDEGKFWVTLPWGGLVATWGLDPSGYDWELS